MCSSMARSPSRERRQPYAQIPNCGASTSAHRTESGWTERRHDALARGEQMRCQLGPDALEAHGGYWNGQRDGPAERIGEGGAERRDAFGVLLVVERDACAAAALKLLQEFGRSCDRIGRQPWHRAAQQLVHLLRRQN